MARALALRTQVARWRAATAGWWPIDSLAVGYLILIGALILPYRHRIPGAGWLLALHIAGILLITIAAHWDRGAGLTWVFRHWYPLPFLALCYREMSILIPAIRGVDLDPEMARLDFALWGLYPTVWLERMHSPWLTEFLQLVYALFFAVVLLVPGILWRRRRYADFRFCAFLISLGFLGSYLGYFLVPARGPRFLLADLQQAPLKGLWSFSVVRQLLDLLESVHYDCFPSGHTALTLIACWCARLVSKNLFRLLSVYTLCMLFSTVYLRYHYTVDLLAGAGLALAVLAAAPSLYGPRRGS